MTLEELNQEKQEMIKKDITIPLEALQDPSKVLYDYFRILLFVDKNGSKDYTLVKYNKFPDYFNRSEFRNYMNQFIKDIREEYGNVWVASPDGKAEIFSVNHIDKDLIEIRYGSFYPNRPQLWTRGYNDPYHHFNTFYRSELMDRPKVNDAKIPILFDRVLDNITSGDIGLKWHLLNWMACHFQTMEKSRTTFIIKGPPGSGKGLMEDIFKGIYGSLYVFSENSAKAISSNFNSSWKDTIMVIFNEADFASLKKDKNQLDALLKSRITEKYINLEHKGKDQHKNYPFHANLMFFSNKDNPLEIADADRRYNVCQTGPNLDKLSWWNKEETYDKIMEELPEIATYLASFDINMKKYNEVYDTVARQEMIDASLDHEIEFSRKVLAADLEWFAEEKNLKQVSGKNYDTGHEYTYIGTIRNFWFKEVQKRNGDKVMRIDAKTLYQVFEAIYGERPKKRLIQNELGTATNWTANSNNIRGFEIPWVPSGVEVIETVEVDISVIEADLRASNILGMKPKAPPAEMMGVA